MTSMDLSGNHKDFISKLSELSADDRQLFDRLCAYIKTNRIDAGSKKELIRMGFLETNGNIPEGVSEALYYATTITSID